MNVADLANDHAALNTNLQTLTSLLKAEPRNSVLALADLRNTNLSNNALMVLMRNAPFAAPYFCKSALIIDRITRAAHPASFIQHGHQTPAKRFSDLQSAKAWLVGNHPPTKYVSIAD